MKYQDLTIHQKISLKGYFYTVQKPVKAILMILL